MHARTAVAAPFASTSGGGVGVKTAAVVVFASTSGRALPLVLADAATTVVFANVPHALVFAEAAASTILADSWLFTRAMNTLLVLFGFQTSHLLDCDSTISQ